MNFTPADVPPDLAAAGWTTHTGMLWRPGDGPGGEGGVLIGYRKEEGALDKARELERLRAARPAPAPKEPKRARARRPSKELRQETMDL